MHKRWCIIAGPRTGSTLLENMIFEYWNRLDPTAISLGEPINTVTGLKSPACLNSEGFLFRSKDNLKKIKTDKLINHIEDTILSGNIEQPIVFKVFTQEEYYSEEQYFNFFKKLEAVGFKFISLNRNNFDQALSLYFMEATGIVHRWNENNNEFFTTTKIRKILNTDTLQSSDLMHINEDQYVNILNKCKKYKLLQEKICNKLSHVKINYETIREDCILEQIPHADPKIFKTYLESYKDKTTPESWKCILKYKENDIKNTACRFAWDYPVLSMSRNELRNCCRAKSNKISDYDFNKGTDLFLKSIPITKVKKELLSGIKSDACSSCWAIEKVDGKSPRSGLENFSRYIKKNLWPNMYLKEIKERLSNLTPEDIDDICNIEKIRMIEISLGNTCDLKCVYCNHHYSSQWAAERLKYKEIPEDQIEFELPKPGNDTEYEKIFWNWFKERSAYSIEYINFIGGEPLIIDKFYDYSKKIIEYYETHEIPQEQVHLGLVTNFNSPKKYFDRFKDLTLDVLLSNKVYLDFNISLEAIGSRTEFIRTNTDWKSMLSNIENYLEFLNKIQTDKEEINSKISVNFQIALNSLCISDLPNFFRFVIDLQKKYNRRIGLRQNQVMYPEWCSPHILPPSYANYIDQSIEVIQSMKEFDRDDYSEYGRWSSYIDFLNSIKSLIQNESKNIKARISFAKNIDQLCDRRNLNFYKTFPEMVSFYEECKKL